MSRTTLISARSTAASQSSSVSCSNGRDGGPPEFVKRASRRPNRSTARSIRYRQSSAFDTSATTGSISAPVLSPISRAVASSSSRRRPLMTTLAPSPANVAATARPMPPDDPATTATASRSPRSTGCRLFRLERRLLPLHRVTNLASDRRLGSFARHSSEQSTGKRKLQRLSHPRRAAQILAPGVDLPLILAGDFQHPLPRRIELDDATIQLRRAAGDDQRLPPGRADLDGAAREVLDLHDPWIPLGNPPRIGNHGEHAVDGSSNVDRLVNVCRRHGALSLAAWTTLSASQSWYQRAHAASLFDGRRSYMCDSTRTLRCMPCVGSSVRPLVRMKCSFARALERTVVHGPGAVFPLPAHLE